MWLTLSLLAAFCWAATNLIDKYLVAKLNLRPLFVLGVLCFLDFSAGVLAFLFVPWEFSGHWLIALFVGALIPYTDILYFKALQQEEVSRVMPWYESSVIMVAIGSAIFLKEILQWHQYLGMALLLGGLITLIWKKGEKIVVGKWVKYILLASAIVAFILIVEKNLLADMSPYQIFAAVGMGSGIGYLPFYFSQRHDFNRDLKKYARLLWKISLSEITGLAAIFLTIAALDSGYATLVSVLLSFQYLFLFIASFIISKHWPAFIEERTDWTTVIIKAVSTAAVIGGIYLVTN